MATYYAQRKTVLNSEPRSATNNYGVCRIMERQYGPFHVIAYAGGTFANKEV